MGKSKSSILKESIASPHAGGVPQFLTHITSHMLPGQFGRYLLVGMWNTLFGYSTFAALTPLPKPHVPQNYILAAALSRLRNTSVTFLGYKWFVFRTKGNYLREWASCIAPFRAAAWSSGLARCRSWCGSYAMPPGSIAKRPTLPAP
jgi:hypothetical protein